MALKVIGRTTWTVLSCAVFIALALGTFAYFQWFAVNSIDVQKIGSVDIGASQDRGLWRTTHDRKQIDAIVTFYNENRNGYSSWFNIEYGSLLSFTFYSNDGKPTGLTFAVGSTQQSVDFYFTRFVAVRGGGTRAVTPGFEALCRALGSQTYAYCENAMSHGL